MTDPKPLQPLLHDEGVGHELRGFLEAGSAHEPSPSDLAALGKRLAAALPPGALPTAPAPPPVTTGASLVSSALGKLAVGVVVVSAIGGGVWLSRSEPPPMQAPSSATSASTPAPSPAPTTSEPPVVDVSALPSVSAANAAPRPSSVPSVAVPSEATLLARAHAELLRGGADEALATATEHARAYPHGSFSQEREVIAIEALVLLDRRDDARKRATVFRQAYPGSSHEARISRLLGAP